MLRAPIVPESDRIRLPAEPALEFRLFDMPEKHLQDGIALGLFELNQPRGKHAIDIQSRAAGLGMRPHHRMLSAGEFDALPSDGLTSLVVARAVMDRGQAAEKPLHRLR